MTQNSVSFSYKWTSRRCCKNFPLESSSLAGPINSYSMPFSSFSFPSLFTHMQIVWIQSTIVCCHNNFSKQFTRNWALRSLSYVMKLVEVNIFWTRRQPRHFFRDFPPRKRRVAQMHRAIYNILLPRTGWHLIPFPSPKECTGVRYVITKFSWMYGLPNFLTLGAPLARFARRSSAINSNFPDRLLPLRATLPLNQRQSRPRLVPR